MNISRFIALVLAALMLAGCNNDALPGGGKYATFKGVVVDGTTGAPLANATVTVDTVLVQTTAADGSFSFPNVPSGDIDYVVKAPDGTTYQSVSDHAHADPLTTATVTVKLIH
ncbi:MAG: hypothetical protein NVS9B12_04430 [Vulcanimicrobiaceae bacterium]